jgi:hypothetical protein
MLSPMGKPPTKLGWRVFWGVVGGGLTGTLLVTLAPGLGLPAIVAISLASGLAVAIVGPALLELLSLA